MDWIYYKVNIIDLYNFSINYIYLFFFLNIKYGAVKLQDVYEWGPVSDGSRRLLQIDKLYLQSYNISQNRSSL